MIYALCNVETGALVSISEQPIDNQGHPLMVKTLDVPMPDMTKQEWDKSGLQFIDKPGNRTMTKLEFRRRFTPAEQEYIDEFNATFEGNERLSAEQKRKVRTGLKNFDAALDVSLADPDIPMLLGLYTMLGLLAEGRAVEILS